MGERVNITSTYENICSPLAEKTMAVTLLKWAATSVMQELVARFHTRTL